jgi:hypothetical protein
MGLHKDVVETNMHEPKNMTTLTGGASDVGKVVVSKGDGTTEVRNLVESEVGVPHEFGQLTITNNAASIAMTAAADATLATNTDYIQVVGVFDAIPHGVNNGITQQTNSLTTALKGDYRVELWADTSATVNSTTIAFKFAVDGVIALVRRPKNFLRNAGEFHNMAAFGIVSLEAGNVITLHMASDKTAGIVLEDAVLDLIMIRKT